MYYWHWLRHILRAPDTSGYPTEPDAAVAAMANPDAIGRLAPPQGTFPRRAAALRHIDGGSCNGCEAELGLLASPDYDLSRYGFSFTPSPKHADLLVVTGVITPSMAPIIQAVYEQMGHPKRVIALGSCAIDGWVFRGAPEVLGSLDGIVPVTVAIAGCPPTPGDILRGLLTAVDGMAPESLREGNSK